MASPVGYSNLFGIIGIAVLTQMWTCVIVADILGFGASAMLTLPLVTVVMSRNGIYVRSHLNAVRRWGC